MRKLLSVQGYQGLKNTRNLTKCVQFMFLGQFCNVAGGSRWPECGDTTIGGHINQHRVRVRGALWQMGENCPDVWESQLYIPGSCWYFDTVIKISKSFNSKHSIRLINS